MFKEHFDRTVIDGESISCRVTRNGVTYLCTATVEADSSYGRPDENDEGFWPTRGGCKSDAAFERALGRAHIIHEAWKNDEWWYAGVRITVELEPQDADSDDEPLILVDGYDCALWGVEVNYPLFDKRRRPNTYLRTVANELLTDDLLEQAEFQLVQYMKDKITMGRVA